MNLWMYFSLNDKYGFSGGIECDNLTDCHVAGLPYEIPLDLLENFEESVWENTDEFENIADEAFELSKEKIANTIDADDFCEEDMCDVVQDIFDDLIKQFRLSYEFDDQKLNVTIDTSVENEIAFKLLSVADVYGYIKEKVKSYFESLEKSKDENRRIQHRNEMLDKLHNIKFEYLWPGDWEDIGFTEREIWVNKKGYGFLYCDEPNPAFWSGDGLEENEWFHIKEKLENETLELSDIQGTSILDALNALYFCGYDPDCPEDVCNDLVGLLELPNGPVGKLFACMGDFKPKFFDSEEECRKKYERDWCDYSWDELEDDILELWIERIFLEERY